MTEQHAEILPARRFSPVWLIPLFAIALGAWMVAQNYLNRGPEITIEFATAEGIVEGKTKIKARSIDIGSVTRVRLSHDFNHVFITARLDKEAAPLLTDDASIWVVRPRIGSGGISGVGTILSGAYIELSPGKGAVGSRFFKGLDNSPVTPAGKKGARIDVANASVGSIQAGDPVLYRGYQVGRTDRSHFDPASGEFKYELFIEAPYDKLIDTATRFWVSSGLTIEADSEGLRVSTGSLENLITGGISFDHIPGSKPGQKLGLDHTFKLYPDFTSVAEDPYQHYAHYLLLFHSSVRGLSRGAPVEYRGIKIGSVVNMSFNYLPEDQALASSDIPVPVLIRIDPARLNWEDDHASIPEIQDLIKRRVDLGLRASLETASLITGQLYVSLNFYDGAEPASLGTVGEYATLPTITTGLEQIERKFVKILDTVEKLPLQASFAKIDGAIEQLGKTLSTADAALIDLKALLSQDELKRLPGTLNQTLAQLKETLAGLSPESALYQDIKRSIQGVDEAMEQIETLARTIEKRPSSLIFSRERKDDPEPKAK